MCFDPGKVFFFGTDLINCAIGILDIAIDIGGRTDCLERNDMDPFIVLRDAQVFGIQVNP